MALDCGVMLAPEDDPKKAFAAAQEGEVFGVTYNTKEFTWWLREDKQAIIIDMLCLLEKTSEHKLRFLKRIVGGYSLVFFATHVFDVLHFFAMC